MTLFFFFSFSFFLRDLKSTFCVPRPSSCAKEMGTNQWTLVLVARSTKSFWGLIFFPGVKPTVSVAEIWKQRLLCHNTMAIINIPRVSQTLDRGVSVTFGCIPIDVVFARIIPSSGWNLSNSASVRACPPIKLASSLARSGSQRSTKLQAAQWRIETFFIKKIIKKNYWQIPWDGKKKLKAICRIQTEIHLVHNMSSNERLLYPAKMILSFVPWFHTEISNWSTQNF